MSQPPSSEFEPNPKPKPRTRSKSVPTPEPTPKWFERPIEIHIRLPSPQDARKHMVAMLRLPVHTFSGSSFIARVTRLQRPLESPAQLPARQMTSLATLAASMSLALIITNAPNVHTASPTSFDQPWRLFYAIAFLLAGCMAVFYWIYSTRLNRNEEFYLRMFTLSLGLIASLGWTFLLVLNVLVFAGSWIGVAPWIFVIQFFGRALATYVDIVDARAVEQMKSLLPESSGAPPH